MAPAVSQLVGVHWRQGFERFAWFARICWPREQVPGTLPAGASRLSHKAADNVCPAPRVRLIEWRRRRAAIQTVLSGRNASADRLRAREEAACVWNCTCFFPFHLVASAKANSRLTQLALAGLRAELRFPRLAIRHTFSALTCFRCTSRIGLDPIGPPVSRSSQVTIVAGTTVEPASRRPEISREQSQRKQLDNPSVGKVNCIKRISIWPATNGKHPI